MTVNTAPDAPVICPHHADDLVCPVCNPPRPTPRTPNPGVPERRPRKPGAFAAWLTSARSSVWFHRFIGLAVIVLWAIAWRYDWLADVRFLSHISMGTALYAVLGTLAPVKLAAEEETDD